MKWLKTSRRKTLYTSQLWVFTIVSVSKYYYLSRSFLIKAILEHRFVNKSMGLTEKLLQQQVLQQLRFWVSIESKKDSWMCHWNIVSASQSFCKFLIVETISYGHMILEKTSSVLLSIVWWYSLKLEVIFEKRCFMSYENQKLELGLIFQIFSLYYKTLFRYYSFMCQFRWNITRGHPWGIPE